MDIKTKIQKFINKFSTALIFALILWGGVFVFSASAASLYFSPSSGSYTGNQSFPVSVYTSSPGQAINAVSGKVSFPQDKLSVSSISKTGSIINLWVQEPSYSNSAGTVEFEGIVLNPGYIGSAGRVITINFRANKSGSVPLTFLLSSVLANDGLGTNILDQTGSANFTILAEQTEGPPSQIGQQSLGVAPSAPQITSSTHSNFANWYNLNDASFSWDIPNGITASRLLVGRILNSSPTVVYSPAIDSKDITELEDGIWYFHVQLRNSNGWGDVNHFRFRIDTESPSSFSIEFPDGDSSDNPKPRVIFTTGDKTSGISHYRIKTDDGEFFRVDKDDIVKSGIYELPLQDPGTYDIIVEAYDNAGNKTVASNGFTVIPIDAPKIIDYSDYISKEGRLTVSGTALAGSKVKIFVQKGDDNKDKAQIIKIDEGVNGTEIEQIITNDKGEFEMVYDEKLDSGKYRLWAQAIDSRGAKSLVSNRVIFEVEGISFKELGQSLMYYLTILIPLIALIIVIVWLVLYTWQRLIEFQTKFRVETRHLENKLYSMSERFKGNAKSQMEVIERIKSRRNLNKQEKEYEKYLARIIQEIEGFNSKQRK
jgi:hypothetical protein